MRRPVLLLCVAVALAGCAGEATDTAADDGTPTPAATAGTFDASEDAAPATGTDVEVVAETYGGCQMGQSCTTATLAGDDLPGDLRDALASADLPAVATAGGSPCEATFADGIGVRVAVTTADGTTEVECLSEVDPSVDPVVAPLLAAVAEALGLG